VYDYNRYAHKGPNGFLNWGMMTGSAFDFAADARGYTIGVTGELTWDDESFTVGRYMMPVVPNQLALDYEGWWQDRVGYYAQWEHRWTSGASRMIYLNNRMRVATYDSANNIPDVTVGDGLGSNTANPRITRQKTGFGFNLEQALSANVGVFARAFETWGDTETMAFTEADSSVSAGVVVQGNAWGRALDSVGLGATYQYASGARQQYLQLGLTDLFIGDGPNPNGVVQFGVEQLYEAYYLFGLSKSTHVTLDWQHIVNPAYNPLRGPVDVFGIRIHTEI
jgi:high affinity Mn2+ porin